MMVTRKAFLRQALAGSVLTAAGMSGRAQQIIGAPKPKVLVVFTPDRPIEWFIDALPMRLTGLPWQEKSERIALPGMNFQDLLLPGFCAVAAKEWPHIDFIPYPDYAIAVSRDASEKFHNAAFPSSPEHSARLDQLLKEGNTVAVINLHPAVAGDIDRASPHGGVKIWLMAAEGSLTKNHEALQYQAYVSWTLGVSIHEIARRGFWGGDGSKSTSAGGAAYGFKLANALGTRAQLAEQLMRRAQEIIEVTRSSMHEVWTDRFGIPTVRERLEMTKERQPYYYTLPF